jgi:UDP-N-acetylglucosamine diphosphorylase/glucosamine-1-phosphate N-acetyltransferase
MAIEQAVILAAGEGERLRPFTNYKPKVMIPIANKPVLQYVVEALSQSGVRQLVMVVGYRKEQVLDFFGSGKEFGVEIDYVTQSQQLGTAHALKQAKAKVDPEFLVVSGDNLIELETIAEFVHTPPDAILLKEWEETSRYGVAVVKDDALVQLVEKPVQPLSCLISTGIYSLSQDIFDLIEWELDLPEVIERMLSQGRRVKAIETSGNWLDVVYPWDILSANGIILKSLSSSIAGTVERGVTIKDPVSIGRGTIVRANSYIVGPVTIGEGCEIGPGVCILPATSIGDHVTISPFSQVGNCVLGDEVAIGPNSTLEDCIIDRGCKIKGHFTARSGEAEVMIGDEHHKAVIGAMLGEHCELGDNVIISPGVMVGNWVRVKGLKLLEANIPDEALVI